MTLLNQKNKIMIICSVRNKTTGDFEPLGNITLSGNNKHFITNTKQCKEGY